MISLAEFESDSKDIIVSRELQSVKDLGVVDFSRSWDSGQYFILSSPFVPGSQLSEVTTSTRIVAMPV